MANNSNDSGRDSDSDTGGPANQYVWKNLRFERFRSQGLFCDIILSTSQPISSAQEQVKAHKMILAEASPFFHKVLGQKVFQESLNKHYAISRIEKGALEHLIKFIYTGTLTLTNENLLSIYQGSKLLELDEATRKCEAFLVEDLNTVNIWQRFKLCKQMGSSNLQQIISYIQNSWDTVTSSEDFLELPCKDLVSLIPQTADDKDLSLSVFSSINAWVNHREVSRKASLLTLMEFIPVNAVPALTWLDFFNNPKLNDIPGFLDFERKTLKSVCLHQAQFNRSQETPTGIKSKVVLTSENPEEKTAEDVDDSDCIKSPITKSSNSSFILSMPDTHEQATLNDNSKRTLEQMFTRSKKPRPDVTTTTESTADRVDSIAESSCQNESIIHTNGDRFLPGRLIYLDNMGAPATFDITKLPGFEVVNFTKQNSVCLDESGGRNACLVYHCNKIYNVGGVIKSVFATDAVHSFDLVTNKWKTEAKLVQARLNHTVVEFGDCLYAIGGSSGKLGLKSVECLNLKSGQDWNSEISSMIHFREAHGTAVYERKLYAIGGYTQAKEAHYNGTCLDSMECYDPATNQWTSKSSMRSERCGMAVAVFNEKLYVIGGGKELQAKEKLQTVEVYNFKINKWTTGKRLNLGRQYASAVVLDGNLYVIGGDSPNSRTVEVFLPEDKKWELVSGILSNRCSYRNVAVKS